MVFAETERLILRELLPDDVKGMFELDADERVHVYLGNQPVKTIEQSSAIINFIRQQYVDDGIGRWAAIEKKTNHFIGWAGLKLIKETINNHTQFYDVGYRFIPAYWGKGYATEAAIASVEYGFRNLDAAVIYGMADAENKASKNVLQKAGLFYVETFKHNGVTTDWFKILKPII